LRALVVNVSYSGAVSYRLDPAYGAAKAGLDKLTFEYGAGFQAVQSGSGIDLARDDSHRESQVRPRENPWGCQDTRRRGDP
jgi:hypothetical protein